MNFPRVSNFSFVVVFVFTFVIFWADPFPTHRLVADKSSKAYVVQNVTHMAVIVRQMMGVFRKTS